MFLINPIQLDIWSNRLYGRNRILKETFNFFLKHYKITLMIPIQCNRLSGTAGYPGGYRIVK